MKPATSIMNIPVRLLYAETDGDGLDFYLYRAIGKAFAFVEIVDRDLYDLPIQVTKYPTLSQAIEAFYVAMGDC